MISIKNRKNTVPRSFVSRLFGCENQRAAEFVRFCNSSGIGMAVGVDRTPTGATILDKTC